MVCRLRAHRTRSGQGRQPRGGRSQVVDFHVLPWRLGRGPDHVSGTEQQAARPTQGIGIHCGLGDSGDHADQARQAGRLHPRTRAPLRAMVGKHGKALARLVHHDVPVQRGHPLLGARWRLGLLRESLPIVEGKSARRDRDLDERCPCATRRLGGLHPRRTSPSPLQ